MALDGVGSRATVAFIYSLSAAPLARTGRAIRRFSGELRENGGALGPAQRRLGVVSVAPATGSVGNARCPGLRWADRGIYAGNRVCVRGWRDYVSLSALVGAERLLGSVKEVIQPQVPLRLPCYDFAPVTALAFGRLPPCGLRHGLRALTASMA